MPLGSPLGANMAPFSLQKSTKILPKVDPKMTHFLLFIGDSDASAYTERCREIVSNDTRRQVPPTMITNSASEFIPDQQKTSRPGARPRRCHAMSNEALGHGKG